MHSHRRMAGRPSHRPVYAGRDNRNGCELQPYRIILRMHPLILHLDRAPMCPQQHQINARSSLLAAWDFVRDRNWQSGIKVALGFL